MVHNKNLFFNIKIYTDLLELTKIRKKQLENEEKIDNKLKSYNTKCPAVINEYFIKYREKNRVMSEELYGSSIIYYPVIISKQLDDIEQNNKIIEQILLSPNICDGLKKYMNNI